MGYRNFSTAIYFPNYEMDMFEHREEFENSFNYLEKQISIDKVYLETYRFGNFTDLGLLKELISFFQEKGISTSGGITFNTDLDGGYKSLCYTRKETIEEVKRIVEFTAGLFDEIILDDFYFTNCKCESCISKKGTQSWSDFRRSLLNDVSKNVIINTAKRINPNAYVIIKYPNWYEDYHQTGYDLETGSQIFDGINTGTETREVRFTQQNLQPYQSYFIVRYLENIMPGKNMGGWFDSFDCRGKLNTYLNQLNLTLLARAKEVTMYSMGLLLKEDDIFVPLAGYAYQKMDALLPRLGNPIGLACYKPYHSSGEDYLHGVLGMMGIPLEPHPFFPKDSKCLLLTQSAAYDEDILSKIQEYLMEKKSLILTTGFIKAMQNKEKNLTANQPVLIKDIIGATVTDKKAYVKEFAQTRNDCAFLHYSYSQDHVCIPQIEFHTNDTWQEIVGIKQTNNYPLLLKSEYGKGTVYVLTVPDQPDDLLRLPDRVLEQIRHTFSCEAPVIIDGESNVSLFLYDNQTFVLQSFLMHVTELNIKVSLNNAVLLDLQNQKTISGIHENGVTTFRIKLRPACCQAYNINIG